VAGWWLQRANPRVIRPLYLRRLSAPTDVASAQATLTLRRCWRPDGRAAHHPHAWPLGLQSISARRRRRALREQGHSSVSSQSLPAAERDIRLQAACRLLRCICRFVALNGHVTMSDLSPQSAPKRTFHSPWPGALAIYDPDGYRSVVPS
jgi:hypothetical protein